MTQPINVSPAAMNHTADEHDAVAEQIAAARAASPEIHAAVASYGPIMHEFKSAVADLLAQRDAALLGHDRTHRDAAAGLRREAMNFVNQDEINAERLRIDP